MAYIFVAIFYMVCDISVLYYRVEAKGYICALLACLAIILLAEIVKLMCIRALLNFYSKHHGNFTTHIRGNSNLIRDLGSSMAFLMLDP